VALGEKPSLRPPEPRLVRWEIFAVLAVSLGASALYALLDLISSLLARQPLSSQQTTLVGSFSANNWLDLAFQLARVTVGLAPVVLVLYLLAREGESPSVIGLDASQPGPDARRGVLLAAVIGGSGLGLYLAAYHLHLSLNVVPENLPPVWWRIPVLLLQAVHNGLLEETVMVGYLLRRLDQLGWPPVASGAVSALLRGCYHLYQGLGGFLGNAVMGAIFAWLYRRWGRVMPLIIAHSLIDAVAFVGYALLHGHVRWLP
jgi:membrane protease YdiL (CAAX protease family)